MTIERKKIELELAKVSSAKLEMEVRIMERQEEIDRLSVNMENQQKRMNELKEQLKEYNKG